MLANTRQNWCPGLAEGRVGLWKETKCCVSTRGTCSPELATGGSDCVCGRGGWGGGEERRGDDVNLRKHTTDESSCEEEEWFAGNPDAWRSRAHVPIPEAVRANKPVTASWKTRSCADTSGDCCPGLATDDSRCGTKTRICAGTRDDCCLGNRCGGKPHLALQAVEKETRFAGNPDSWRSRGACACPWMATVGKRELAQACVITDVQNTQCVIPNAVGHRVSPTAFLRASVRGPTSVPEPRHSSMP